MRALAVRFPLALHLNDLPVLPNHQRGIERRQLMKIALLVFKGKNQVRMRRDGVRHLEIILRVLVKILGPETPGSIDHHFIQFFTNLGAKYFQQFDVALFTM